MSRIVIGSSTVAQRPPGGCVGRQLWSGVVCLKFRKNSLNRTRPSRVASEEVADQVLGLVRAPRSPEAGGGAEAAPQRELLLTRLLVIVCQHKLEVGGSQQVAGGDGAVASQLCQHASLDLPGLDGHEHVADPARCGMR